MLMHPCPPLAGVAAQQTGVASIAYNIPQGRGHLALIIHSSVILSAAKNLAVTAFLDIHLITLQLYNLMTISVIPDPAALSPAGGGGCAADGGGLNSI